MGSNFIRLIWYFRLQICAGGVLGQDACGGDSGGALVAVGKFGPPFSLIGITSFGTGRDSSGTVQCGKEVSTIHFFASIFRQPLFFLSIFLATPKYLYLLIHSFFLCNPIYLFEFIFIILLMNPIEENIFFIWYKHSSIKVPYQKKQIDYKKMGSCTDIYWYLSLLYIYWIKLNWIEMLRQNKSLHLV